MLDKLEAFDQSLMLYLNGLHSPYMDIYMHYVSEAPAWIPFFAVVVYLVFRKYSWRGLLFFLLATGICITLCDRISVELFKNVFKRYRPCHNGEIGDMMHLYDDHCGGMYGFVSSHATNFFGLATLFALTLRKHYKYASLIFFLWAVLIGYSRIYLGVHYPADVFGGGILGILLGVLSFQIFRFAVLKRSV